MMYHSIVEGTSHMRRVLIELAQHASRHNPGPKRVCNQIAKRVDSGRMPFYRKDAFVTKGTRRNWKHNRNRS